MHHCMTLLLGTSLLALLGLSGCGGSRIPEDELIALLNEQTYFTERLAGVESLEIAGQSTEDGVTEIDAAIVSHNGFTRYTDDCTIELARDEETEEWTVTHLGGATTSMEALYAPDAYAIDQVMTTDTYCMLGIGGGSEECLLLPGYTLGEVTLSNENPQFPAATAQIDFEGQTYGWFTFHGGATLQLTYEPVRGGWEANGFTPNEDFSVDCALEGRTYQTEAFRDRESYSDDYQDHCWYVTFGDFDWREGGLVGCTARKYNLEEGTDGVVYDDRCYRIHRITPGTIFHKDSDDWVLAMAPGKLADEQSFPMRTLDDPTATDVIFWELGEALMDHCYDCEQVGGPTPDSLTVTTPEPAALPVPEIAPEPGITADPEVADKVVMCTGEELYTFGDDTPDEHYTAQYFHDAQGNEVGFKYYREGELFITAKSIYNANNVKTAYFRYLLDSDLYEATYYDLDGNEILYISGSSFAWDEGPSDEHYSTKTYTYDRLGRVTEVAYSNGNSTSYSYDDPAYRGWKHYYYTDSAGDHTVTTNLHFDTDWRLIGEEVLDEDGNVSQMVSHEYDGNGNLVHQLTTLPDGSTEVEEVYTFDEYGNMLECRIDYFYNGMAYETHTTTRPLSEALKEQDSWSA